MYPAALEVLATVAPLRPADEEVAAFVFPGEKRGRPLSVVALTMVTRRLNADATVHGFRSAFRAWHHFPLRSHPPAPKNTRKSAGFDGANVHVCSRRAVGIQRICWHACGHAPMPTV
jgi:hypothetical protein